MRIRLGRAFIGPFIASSNKFPKRFSTAQNFCAVHEIKVSPECSLIDERVRFNVSHLKCNLTYTLHLNVSNGANLNFDSFTHFKSNKLGAIDTECCHSIDCSSHKPQLFDSMQMFRKLKNRPNSDQRFWSACVENGFQCNLYVYEGFVGDGNFSSSKVVCGKNFSRKYLSDGVVKRKIKDGGIQATLFYNENLVKPQPAIITLHGGKLRDSPVEDTAAALANHGYVTLALAYYGLPGTPPDIVSQPLEMEYFEKATDLLLNMPEVDSSGGIGVWGISKGAEMALSMATYFGHKIGAVILVNGIPFNLLVPTKYKGRVDVKPPPLPFEKVLNAPQIRPDVLDISSFGEEIPDFDISQYIPFWKNEHSTQFMFLGGEDDQLFDTRRCLEKSRELSEKFNVSHRCRFKSYPGLGHLVDLPFAPVTQDMIHPLFPKQFKIYYGGDDEEMHGRAQECHWFDTLQFFDETLKQHS